MEEKIKNTTRIFTDTIRNLTELFYVNKIMFFCDLDFTKCSIDKFFTNIMESDYIKSNDKLEIYKKYLFTIHVFNDEYTLKQKVRLQMIY